MNIRRTITVITMACGGVLALTPPAAATPSSFGALAPSTFVEVYNSADVPESSVQSATVPCPAGMAVVSTGGGGSELDSITPGADYASGVTTTRAERGERDDIVVAQATCAPIAQFAGTSVATSREQYRHSVLGEWTQTITCPAGMRAFAGGGFFKTSTGAISKDGYFMYANTPTLDGRGWTDSAMDQTFTDRLVVTTRCAPQSSSTRLVEETFPIVPAPGTSVGRANGYAHCPAGYLPISGGAQVTQDGPASSAQTHFVWSVSVQNGQIGWFASANSGGEHSQLHVVALCGR